MSVILVLITASFALAIVFLGLFVWAIKSGQFEDDYTPSVRILLEETDMVATEIGRAHV